MKPTHEERANDRVEAICKILAPLITACYNEPEKAKVTAVVDTTVANLSALLTTHEREVREKEQERIGEILLNDPNKTVQAVGKALLPEAKQ